MLLVDAHCHLNEIKSYALSDRVLPVTTGYSHSSNMKNIEIAKSFSIPFVLGISPQAAQKEGVERIDEWAEWIRNARPNAIGEIGLDYHWARTREDTEKQHIAFGRMLDLAEEMHLPVVIHARQADSEILDILAERKFPNGFMMHFFSGDEKEAQRIIGLGGYISIIPLRSRERRNTIASVDLEHLLIETDAPAVVRFPEDVEKSCAYISEVKKLDFSIVAGQTARNAKRFFGF